MTPENLATLQAEVAAKRQRKEDRAGRRLAKAYDRQLGSEVTEAIGSLINEEADAKSSASSQNKSQASGLATDPSTRQRIVTAFQDLSSVSIETLSPQSASVSIVRSPINGSLSPQSASSSAADSLSLDTVTQQRIQSLYYLTR